MRKDSPKRKYDSSRRKNQARQTRQQIIEAARNLFTSRGYSGATIESIAEEAGVAVETVYASFGNKRSILSSLIGISLVGDDEPTPLLKRKGPLSVMHEKDQRRQLQLFSSDIADIMARVAPLFEVMRAASKTEPDIAEMLHTMLNERVDGMLAFVKVLASNGPLREGITPEKAAETVWAVTSGEVYSLLVVDRGWKVEQYKVWLLDTLTRLLLP